MSVEEWIDLAEGLGPGLAEHAERHDLDATFVSEGYGVLKDRGFGAALVPVELGGRGAGVREVCEFIRTLGGYCGSTALAFSMHTHLVAATVWRHMHGQDSAPLLRRIAEERLVLVSTGANDWLESNGVMERVDGGYRYTASKPFASGSPIGDAMITSGRFDSPQEGPQVIHFALPFSAEGVSLGKDWDTMGMRGTGSDTVDITNAFIPDQAITFIRPRGPWHPVFYVISTVALPFVMSPYVGVAERAARLAIAAAAAKRDDPDVQYLVGELSNHITTAKVLWSALIDNAAEFNFEPDPMRASRSTQIKSVLADCCIATVTKAMEVCGGQGFFRHTGIERLMRDVRGALYHPLQPKRQHRFSGRLALGLEPD